MVLLICAVVGEGSTLSNVIGKGLTINVLKDAIKAKIEDMEFPARNLQLFLAKKNGAWLESGTGGVARLKKGENFVLIEKMTHKEHELQGGARLQEELKGVPDLPTDQIHLLVRAEQPIVRQEATGKRARVHVRSKRKGEEWKAAKVNTIVP